MSLKCLRVFPLRLLIAAAVAALVGFTVMPSEADDLDSARSTEDRG